MSQARFHCRDNAQRLVHRAEVVVHKVQRNRRFVLLDLLSEGIRQTCKVVHGQVLALYVGRAMCFGSGLTVIMAVWVLMHSEAGRRFPFKRLSPVV